MTSFKGNSEFCFPSTFNVPHEEVEDRVETKLTVSLGASNLVLINSL